MKDLNRVLLVLLLDATIGPVSSGRNLDYRATFSRTERSTVGMTPRDAIQRHLVWFSEGLFAPTRVPTGGVCRADAELPCWGCWCCCVGKPVGVALADTRQRL